MCDCVCACLLGLWRGDGLHIIDRKHPGTWRITLYIASLCVYARGGVYIPVAYYSGCREQIQWSTVAAGYVPVNYSGILTNQSLFSFSVTTMISPSVNPSSSRWSGSQSYSASTIIRVYVWRQGGMRGRTIGEKVGTGDIKTFQTVPLTWIRSFNAN